MEYAGIPSLPLAVVLGGSRYAGPGERSSPCCAVRAPKL